MFDFSFGEFKLAEVALFASKENKRQRTEQAPSIRVYVKERDDGGWNGLTAAGLRVSGMVDFLGVNWQDQWATAELTNSGYVIVGGAAFDGAEPEPQVDGDGG